MMLDYLGRKRDAALMELAIWKALEKDLFQISPDGRVEGGAKGVASALKGELERCYQEGK